MRAPSARVELAPAFVRHANFGMSPSFPGRNRSTSHLKSMAVGTGRAACLAVLLPGALACGGAEPGDTGERVRDTAGVRPAAGLAAEVREAGRAAARVIAGDAFEVTAVLVGAGDIGRCSSAGHDATARLLDTIEGTVFTLGDNAYPDGAPSQFTNCYGRSWGRHRARTRPTPGNHDYRVDDAAGYYDYFGAAAGPRGEGYYRYALGGWTVLALNSVIATHRRSPQLAWLRRELAASPTRCTVAYWHESRFSSGEHGNSRAMRAIWEALHEAGVDVVVTGHDHNYERFAPQTPAGVADSTRGIRAFIVGTGGAGLRPLGTIKANSEFRDASHFGVLKLALGASGYRWSFVTTPDGIVADSGTGLCH